MTRMLTAEGLERTEARIGRGRFRVCGRAERPFQRLVTAAEDVAEGFVFAIEPVTPFRKRVESTVVTPTAL
jgi:hypothetical protein